MVEGLKAQGKAILFISHKFDEIFRIADNYTVFRDGANDGSGCHCRRDRARIGQDDGWPGRRQIFPQRDRKVWREDVLTVEGYDHPNEFADINFTLNRGEILGFYGLVGAGRSEFMQALFGMRRNRQQGHVRIDGKVPR